MSVLLYNLVFIVGLTAETNIYHCNGPETCSYDFTNKICGFCINRFGSEKNTGEFICKYPFSYYKEGPECKVDDSCFCSNFGTCVPGKENGTYNCRCRAGFYGLKCELPTPSQLANVIPLELQYEVVTILRPNDYRLFTFWCSCTSGEVSTRLSTKVETNIKHGYFELREKSRIGCRYYAPDSDPLLEFKMKVRFPYVYFNEDANAQFLVRGIAILGYLTTYEVILKVQEIEITRSFNVFVSYGSQVNLHCVPRIKLFNCAPSQNKMVEFTRSRQISLRSSVDYIGDGEIVNMGPKSCTGQSFFHWRIWRNHNTDDFLESIEVFDKTELDFIPFSLMDGTYRVLLEVKKHWVKKSFSKNFAYCYFQVALERLVAIIEGGSERTVTRKNGLILDARRSKDPNQPHDNQTFLYATWHCIPASDDNEDICSTTMPVSEVLIVGTDKLVMGETYNIKLTVWTNIYEGNSVQTAFSTARVTVSDDSIAIECLLNCEERVITSEPLLLKAKRNEGHGSDTYKWTYSGKGQKEENNMTLIAEFIDEVKKTMIKVRKNALEKGKSYTIRLTSLSSNETATYSFQTERKVDINILNCSVNPTLGVRGITLFDIICDNFESLSPSLIFEFYDKYPEEADLGLVFSGRMLGTSYTGKLENVELTRGSAFVYVLSEKALQTYKRFTIELSPLIVTDVVLNEMFKNLTEKVKTGRDDETMRYLSVIADLIPHNIDKSEILDKLLNFITYIPANSLPNVKLRTSTLYNILLTLNKPKQLVIKPELLRDTFKIIYQQTLLLRNTVGFAESLQGMSSTEIREVAKYELDSMHAALHCRDRSTERVNEFDYDLETLYALMECSNFIEDIITLVQDILTFLQAPGQPPTKLETTNNYTVMWVIKNDNEYKITSYLSLKAYHDIPIRVSEKLLAKLEKETDDSKGYFTLRVAKTEDDIFWWHECDIMSNFISVSPVIQSHKMYDIREKKSVEGIFTLFVNIKPFVKSLVISGTSMIDTRNEIFDLDNAVKIHRLDPVPKSILTLKFLFPQTSGSVRVFVTNLFRPTYTHFIHSSSGAQIIGEENPSYVFQRKNADEVYYQNKKSFVYVGILPIKSNQNVSYTFEVNNTLCQNWVRGRWSSQGCKTIIRDQLQVSCECKHFSTFAVGVMIPPNEINPFTDIKLFLTVPRNPLVVSFVSAILLLYLVLFIWAWRKDKLDRQSKNVVILSDNFPGDRYPYLLAVYTGSRFEAGTTADVGIRLIGDLAESRIHILTCQNHTILKRTHDDWFLIFCSQHLGTVQSIHIWHNNAGSSPDWFLSKISVYDLTYNIQLIFLVEDWLALRPNAFPEATVTPATAYQVNNVKRIFIDNCVLGMREGHSFLSIFLRHPRSEISRLQRISVYMCLIMVAMLCSIMFYYPYEGEGVDDSLFEMEIRDLKIAIQCLFITLVPTFFVLFAFKRSNKYRTKNITARSTTYFKHEESNLSIQSELSKCKSAKTQTSTRYKCFKFFTKTIEERPLIPAQLPQSKPTVIMRKKWQVIAWISCFTILLLSSFFVMLYGLKLGKVKSQKWLTFVVLMLGEDIFIVGPVKVITFAAILSVALNKLYDEETHRVTLQDAAAIRFPDDEAYIHNILVIRHQNMYKLIPTDVREEMMTKKRLKENILVLIDFSITLIYVVVISVLMFRLWSSNYHSNTQIANCMNYYASTDSRQFFSIKYRAQMENYLWKTFIKSLYNTFWYNKMPLDERSDKRGYYSQYFVHSAVGLQLLRQLRVVSKKCLSKYIKTDQRCIPHLNTDTEDVGIYDTRWEHAEYSEREKEIWPWKHTEETTSVWFTMYRLYGASGTLYGDGGFLTLLGPNRDNVQRTMLELLEHEWQDVLTRVVIVEFTLYNANVDLLSQVTMIVEYLLGGTIQQKIQVTSIQTKMKWEFWNVLFLMFVLYDIVVSGALVNKFGLFEFLKETCNKIQVVKIVLGCSCTAVAVTHYYKSNLYYDEFIHSGNDTYFDFDTFVFYFLILKVLLSLLLAAAMFRAISTFQVSRTLLIQLKALNIATRKSTWLILFTILTMAIQYHFLIVLNIFSVTNIQELLLGPKSFKRFKAEDFKHIHVKVLFFVKTAFLTIVEGLFIVVFWHYTRIAKTFKTNVSIKSHLGNVIMKKLAIKIKHR